MDLHNDWIIIGQNAIDHSPSCTSDTEGLDDDPAKLVKLAQGISTLVAPRGSYQWSRLNKLTFAFEEGSTSVTGEADDSSRFIALALISPDAIEGETRVVFLTSESRTSPIWLVLMFLPPGFLA